MQSITGYCDRCGVVTEELTDVAFRHERSGAIFVAPWCADCVVHHAVEVDGWGMADRDWVATCDRCRVDDAIRHYDGQLCERCAYEVEHAESRYV